MTQHIWSPNWEEVPGSESPLWVRLEKLQFGSAYNPRTQTTSSSICEHIAGLVSCSCCFALSCKTWMLLSLGLLGQSPSKGSAIFGAARLAFPAGRQSAQDSHALSEQCPGRSEATQGACYALSLKPKQDCLIFLTVSPRVM